jgi:hypothetical protein
MRQSSGGFGEYTFLVTDDGGIVDEGAIGDIATHTTVVNYGS